MTPWRKDFGSFTFWRLKNGVEVMRNRKDVVFRVQWYPYSKVLELWAGKHRKAINMLRWVA